MVDMNRTMLTTDERIAVVRFLAYQQELSLFDLALNCEMSEQELSERLENWHFTPKEMNAIGRQLKLERGVKLSLFLDTESEKPIILD